MEYAAYRDKKVVGVIVRMGGLHGYYNEDGYICVNNRHIYKRKWDEICR
jgi:hypothetical protein